MVCKAVVLIGGPGKATNFRPLSFRVPKPLFPVAGEPLIYHHIAACAKLPGLLEVLILGGHDESLFQEFMASSTERLGIKIRYLKERSLMGTAGGILHYSSDIMSGMENDPTAAIFVLHGDISCSFPLEEMLEFHSRTRPLGTILSRQVAEEESRHFGCLIHDPQTRELLHYAEKPETFVSNCVNCGVYLFSTGVFPILRCAEPARDEFDNPVMSRGISPARESPRSDGPPPLDLTLRKVSFEQDVLTPLAGTRQLYVYETEDWWTPVKLPGEALLATAQLLSRRKSELATNGDGRPGIIGNVFIHSSTTVHETARIGPNVYIGQDCHIGAGVRIVNSILLDGVRIKDRACVIRSIVGWDSTVGAWSRVEGCPGKITDVVVLGDDVSIGNEICVRNCIVLPHKGINDSCSEAILL
mmetsp:Transcript_2642/g.6366  ORF Transcript_2642/g.6366 Transcript_2642/m.6366 type:complete len:415 (+) Transcript_2642:53-1297(+)|eukprot:CAMPEP_0177649662 /NCGR_PEP_ID=MMETSP0447-20121125/11514_1 /TAXON_ID=0 /ORGANISM="Stygamoeba regulata, Strain BSH-02190019" /LENGTH=414 /DNA_ID=CAMNT_0019152451 /DNA_START=42 /DNA_END=1286 /DNA_ORIENTATION=+